jgi:UDP-N-acetyl-D-glucosamine dehydrogenase
VLGIAYKRDIDDMRESPALDVMRLLEARGAEVVYHDPHVASFREEGHEAFSVALTAAELQRADAVVVITDHKAIDYQLVADNAGLVIDTRHVFSKTRPGKARVIALTSSAPVLAYEGQTA